MAKIKKYYPGSNGLTTSNVGGITNPNKFSTGKFLFPKQETLGKIIDNKVMSQDYLSSKGPSFMDKAGAFMGNYGGAITQAAGTLMPLLMKKPDPNAKPYKKGTNMIKYQQGTNSAKNMKYILEQNRDNAVMNTILMANAANIKRNAELNSRVAPKKLEGKKASIKTDSLKTNKPNLIKYQAGAEEIIGPGPLDNLPQMSPEQLKSFNAYDSKKEIAEAIERVNKMGAPITPLTPKMASFQAPEQTPMAIRPNPVSIPKLSRKERKMENARMERLLKKEDPIEYLSPKMAFSSVKDIDNLVTRLDAQKARDTYEARLAGESARSAYEAKQKGTPITDALLKSTMSSQAFKETLPAKKNITYAENKGGYARALKSGKVSEKGHLVDPNTGLEYKDLRKKSSSKPSSKSGGAKPLVKMKEDSWTESQWKDFYNKRNNSIQGQELVRMKNNPYAMAGFNIPFNQPGKQSVTDGQKQKPATNIPSPIMDYKKINKINDSIDSERKIFKKEKRAFSLSDYYKPFFDSYYGDIIREDYEIKKNPSAPKVEKRTEQKTTTKAAPKPMTDAEAEEMGNLLKHFNTKEKKRKGKEILVQLKKSGNLKYLKDEVEYKKNMIGGRYKAPEAPRAQNGINGVKTYWDRVKSDNVFMRKGPNDIDPRMSYDYEKLAPWGKVKSEGVIDYLSTLFAMPQKEINHLLTKRYETPIETYNLSKHEDNRIKGIPKVLGDIATDPMMYPEAAYAGGKLVAQGAVKTGKAIGKALQKIPYAKLGKYIEKFGGKLLSEKGRIGQALLHFNEDSKEKEERERNRPSFEMK